MVSVDVKHHVYLRGRRNEAAARHVPVVWEARGVAEWLRVETSQPTPPLPFLSEVSGAGFQD